LNLVQVIFTGIRKQERVILVTQHVNHVQDLWKLNVITAQQVFFCILQLVIRLALMDDMATQPVKTASSAIKVVRHVLDLIIIIVVHVLHHFFLIVIIIVRVFAQLAFMEM
jgi:hypothetical protein